MVTVFTSQLPTMLYLLTKKMDTVLAKLQKLDSIENRLDILFKAVSLEI